MSDPAIRLSAPPEPAATDTDGMLVEQHVARVHYTCGSDHGELLLCGKAVSYPTFVGTAPGAPECRSCKALDA